METDLKDKIEKLMKREYMRGQIDRSNGKYSLESLEKRYKRYRECNPEVEREMDEIFQNIEKG